MYLPRSSRSLLIHHSNVFMALPPHLLCSTFAFYARPTQLLRRIIFCYVLKYYITTACILLFSYLFNTDFDSIRIDSKTVFFYSPTYFLLPHDRFVKVMYMSGTIQALITVFLHFSFFIINGTRQFKTRTYSIFHPAPSSFIYFRLLILQFNFLYFLNAHIIRSSSNVFTNSFIAFIILYRIVTAVILQYQGFNSYQIPIKIMNYDHNDVYEVFQTKWVREVVTVLVRL